MDDVVGRLGVLVVCLVTGLVDGLGVVDVVAVAVGVVGLPRTRSCGRSSGCCGRSNVSFRSCGRWNGELKRLAVSE